MCVYCYHDPHRPKCTPTHLPTHTPHIFASLKSIVHSISFIEIIKLRGDPFRSRVQCLGSCRPLLSRTRNTFHIIGMAVTWEQLVLIPFSWIFLRTILSEKYILSSQLGNSVMWNFAFKKVFSCFVVAYRPSSFGNRLTVIPA